MNKSPAWQMMDVRVGDKVESRKVDYFDKEAGKLVPELREGEIVMQMLGTQMPYVAKVSE